MKTNNLTIKQEKFCQAYIRLGDKSAAYREVYACANMKPETVNRKAFELFKNGKITARVEFLQSEIAERNKIDIDELVKTLAGMVRFDIAELYDEHGALKSIHEIPKESRLMISQLEADEIKAGGMVIGFTKKLKLFDKLGAVEKLMKHLGGYEKDNSQRNKILTSDDREERIRKLEAKAAAK